MEMEAETTNALLGKVDKLSSLDDEETEKFVESALKTIEGHLRSNRRVAENTGIDVRMTIEETLDPDNVEHIQVRARHFENPRITVWLKDCPSWSNDAWNDAIYPKGMNAYNGKVHTILDVRPY